MARAELIEALAEVDIDVAGLQRQDAVSRAPLGAQRHGISCRSAFSIVCSD
jgi:hypothetical protein